MPSLAPNAVYLGDCRRLLPMVERESVALSLWSPPYFVGKSYERDLSFAEWQALLREVLRLHHPLLRPGGFVVVNIAGEHGKGGFRRLPHRGGMVPDHSRALTPWDTPLGSR